jgi:hypothetical protein
MAKAGNFDWSIINRPLIVDIIKLAGANTINTPLSTLEFTKEVRQLLRLFKIPVSVRTCYNKITTKNHVWVGGLYNSADDKKSKKSIIVELQFHNKDDIITISKNKFNRICYSVADTVLHEIIHLRQYRRRNFKFIPGYDSVASSSKQRTEQIYLGHNDEIDAYSFNIACQLLDRFKNDRSRIVNYLNNNLNDKRKKKDCYKMYLEVFDHDHDHNVIKKLKKKIINYMPNALEIKKPYKTSDWLKK